MQILLLLALTPILAKAANVGINVSNSVFAVTDAIMGIHTSVYDNQHANGSLPSRLIESGVNTLRYPGGGYADVYHWAANKNSPWFGSSSDFGYIASGADFASFVKLLTNSQAQAIITVNYGSGQRWNGSKTQMVIPGTNGTAEEAVAWVAYANASTNDFVYGSPGDMVIGNDALSNNWKTVGFWAKLRASTPAQFSSWAGTNFESTLSFLAINRAAPLGIKYWEIGNETFGTGYYDASLGDGYSVNYSVPYDATIRFGHTNLSPGFYGAKVKAFALAMKAVDPTIKIGAVLSTPPDDTWDLYNGKRWNTQVLAQCSSQIDFVIPHWYPYAGEAADGSNLLSYVRIKLPRMINGATAGLDVNLNAGLRDQISLYRSDVTNVQIFLTEFNYFGYLTNGTPNGFGGTNPIAGPLDALFAADTYATCMNLGFANVDYLEMSQSKFVGDSAGLVRGGVFYAIEMVRKLGTTGDQILNPTSDAILLRAQAVLQQEKRLGLLLINESATSNQTVTVTITNALLAGTGMRYQFGVTNFSSITTPSLPTSGPTTNALSGLTNTFTVAVPPLTMVTLLLDISTNTPPGFTTISNWTVNVGQTVAFTANAIDAESPPQTLTYQLLITPQNSTIDPSSGLFSFRPQVGDADTTYLIRVKVADNGLPSMSTTQYFEVAINPLTLPAVEATVSPEKQIRLQVTGQTGPDYAIEASTNIFDWATVLITNSPPQPFFWTDTNVMDLPMRLYRVKVGPPLP